MDRSPTKQRDMKPELSQAQKQLMHEIIAEGRWRRKGDLEIMEEAARVSPDLLKMADETEKAGPVVAKPLWARLGIGLPGLILITSQLWFEQWDREYALGLEHAMPWLRFFALIIGGIMLVIAAPAPVAPEKIELKSGRRC